MRTKSCSQTRTDVANHRVQQTTRSPTAGAHRQRTRSFNLPKQAKPIAQGFCCVSLQAQYQAFVHVAVESSTAIALKQTCVLEPFNRGAFVSGLHPLLPAGPATLDRCCGRNV